MGRKIDSGCIQRLRCSTPDGSNYFRYHESSPNWCGWCEELYRGADKSLAQPTSQCILSDGENISFDASLVIYINIYIYIYSSN